MLNSKYAPIVALTVLGILIVAALGWFLAIKPQFDKAGAYGSDEDLVRANIATVAADGAALAQAGEDADGFTDLAPSIALNAPSSISLEAFRTRVSDAVESSGVELSATEQSRGVLVEGWEIAPGLLPSSSLAQRFQSGPAATVQVPPEAFEPAATAPTDAAPLATGLAMLPFSYTVFGSTEEIHDFLAALGDPTQQFFQVFEYTITALSDSDTVPEGISEPAAGDAQAVILGALYLAEVDTTSTDEGPMETAGAPAESPFLAPGSDAPEQSGAN